MRILWQTVWHVLEPQDPSARPYWREAVRLPPLRGHVQAEGPPVEAPVLGAPERHYHHERGGPDRRE